MSDATNNRFYREKERHEHKYMEALRLLKEAHYLAGKSMGDAWYDAATALLSAPSAGVRTITLTTDQQQRGVGAYQQWKANESNPASSAFGGNLHDLARRMYEAMTNADPQERSAEASSRADGEASAAKKPGATASTPCQPGEAETPCGSAPVTPSATEAPIKEKVASWFAAYDDGRWDADDVIINVAHALGIKPPEILKDATVGPGATEGS